MQAREEQAKAERAAAEAATVIPSKLAQHPFLHGRTTPRCPASQDSTFLRILVMPGEESCRGEGSNRCQEGAMLVRDMSREGLCIPGSVSISVLTCPKGYTPEVFVSAPSKPNLSRRRKQRQLPRPTHLPCPNDPSATCRRRRSLLAAQVRQPRSGVWISNSNDSPHGLTGFSRSC